MVHQWYMNGTSQSRYRASFSCCSSAGALSLLLLLLLALLASDSPVLFLACACDGIVPVEVMLEDKADSLNGACLA